MIIGRTETNIHINLLFLIADIVETLMMDVQSMMKSEETHLRQESKRNFNAMLKAAKMLRKNVNQCSSETNNDYANDSDRMYEYIKLLIDRVGTDDTLFYNLYCDLKKLPSKENMKNLNTSIFDDVELELDGKIKRHIAAAKKVFSLESFKEPFNKKAYYARLITVRSLTLDGLHPEKIAKGLGLSLRTIKRLRKADECLLKEDAEYKILIERFYNEYYEGKVY